MKNFLKLVAAIALLTPIAPALAQQDAEEAIIKTVVERVFSEAEEMVIRDYFGIKVRDEDNHHHSKREYKGGKHKDLPPGLAKRDTLPPGLARQLTENGALPPGLAKRDLPEDLLSRLPARKGTKRVIVDNDILLIEEGTEIVLDIIEDILTGSN